MNNPEELTVRCQRFLSRMPVIVGYSLRSGTSQICVRWQHSLEQLLDALRYFPSSHPLASHLLFCLSDRWLYRRKKTHGARPIFFKVFFGVKLLAIVVLEGSSSDKNLKESNTKGPHVRFTSIVRDATSSLRWEILFFRSVQFVDIVDIRLTSGVP